jgi:PIN domain nuclease of toxin-antitoxin system
MSSQALLLDSNIVVWLNENLARIPRTVLQQIEDAPEVFLSAVTAWELGIKESTGGLTLAKPVSTLINTHAMTELPVSIKHGEAVKNLPYHHRDPFDRLLIAQATVEGLILVTADRVLLNYGIPIILI